MRRHYSSLNYIDAAPDVAKYRFTRTQGSTAGYITGPYQEGREPIETTLLKSEVERLRDMLNEVLEDWK